MSSHPSVPASAFPVTITLMPTSHPGGWQAFVMVPDPASLEILRHLVIVIRGIDGNAVLPNEVRFALSQPVPAHSTARPPAVRENSGPTPYPTPLPLQTPPIHPPAQPEMPALPGRRRGKPTIPSCLRAVAQDGPTEWMAYDEISGAMRARGWQPESSTINNDIRQAIKVIRTKDPSWIEQRKAGTAFEYRFLPPSAPPPAPPAEPVAPPHRVPR